MNEYGLFYVFTGMQIVEIAEMAGFWDGTPLSALLLHNSPHLATSCHFCAL